MRRIIALLIILNMLVSCGRLNNEYQRRLNEQQQVQIDSLYTLLNKKEEDIKTKKVFKEKKEVYYIVIGSFANIENAYDMQNTTSLNTKIKYVKDFYRVIVDSASTTSTLSRKYKGIKGVYTGEIITIKDD